jgi:hypothetical protein
MFPTAKSYLQLEITYEIEFKATRVHKNQRENNLFGEGSHSVLAAVVGVSACVV